MKRDAIHLNAHFGALETASARYAEASTAHGGTAFGVELRTLAAARRAMADRFAERLRDLGAEPRRIAAPGFVDLGSLLGDDPRAGAEAILRGERALADEIEASGDDGDLTEGTRTLLLSTLTPLRAHVRRVEAFLDTL